MFKWTRLSLVVKYYINCSDLYLVCQMKTWIFDFTEEKHQYLPRVCVVKNSDGLKYKWDCIHF